MLYIKVDAQVINWQIVISSKFGTKYRKKVSYFWRQSIFLQAQVRQGGSRLSAQNKLDAFSHFKRTATCDTQTQDTEAYNISH